MNILIDDLPITVLVNNQQLPINTDYRTGILFEQTLADMTLSEDEKIITVLTLYYRDVTPLLLSSVDLIQEALAKIVWFYHCGVDKSITEQQGDSFNKEPPFSYDYDAGYIYAAFLQTYQIDLTQNKLHWWQFRALFLALPDTVPFCKIMGYRTMDIPTKISKEQQKFYRKMKRIYKLPESIEQVKLKEEIETILEQGGDISSFLL